MKVCFLLSLSILTEPVMSLCNWGPEGNGQNVDCTRVDPCQFHQELCESSSCEDGKWCDDLSSGPGYCDWGQDRTGETAACTGVPGGVYCSTNEANCRECDGVWCSEVEYKTSDNDASKDDGTSTTPAWVIAFGTLGGGTILAALLTGFINWKKDWYQRQNARLEYEKNRHDMDAANNPRPVPPGEGKNPGNDPVDVANRQVPMASGELDDISEQDFHTPEHSENSLQVDVECEEVVKSKGTEETTSSPSSSPRANITF